MPSFIRESDISIFAKADARGSNTPFGIKQADRRGHMYIIGKTGTGKSTLLETLMIDDLLKGRGFAVLDPHGDLIKRIRSQIPDELADRVIDFDASDPQTPYGFNPLGFMHVDKRPLAASGLVQVFKHLWVDSWGPRLEYILRNCLVSLLDFPNAKFTDIPKLLSNPAFRADVLKFVRNEETREFWINEYNKYPERFRLESISPIQNKVGAFLSNSLLRRILTNPERPLNLRRSMDAGKIVLRRSRIPSVTRGNSAAGIHCLEDHRGVLHFARSGSFFQAYSVHSVYSMVPDSKTVTTEFTEQNEIRTRLRACVPIRCRKFKLNHCGRQGNGPV